TRHGHHHIVKNTRAAPYFLSPDAFIVPVLAAALRIGCCVGSESVGVDAKRPIALVLCISASQTRYHRDSAEILGGNLSDGLVEHRIRGRVVRLAESAGHRLDRY